MSSWDDRRTPPSLSEPTPVFRYSSYPGKQGSLPQTELDFSDLCLFSQSVVRTGSGTRRERARHHIVPGPTPSVRGKRGQPKGVQEKVTTPSLLFFHHRRHRWVRPGSLSTTNRSGSQTTTRNVLVPDRQESLRLDRESSFEDDRFQYHRSNDLGYDRIVVWNL